MTVHESDRKFIKTLKSRIKVLKVQHDGFLCLTEAWVCVDQFSFALCVTPESSGKFVLHGIEGAHLFSASQAVAAARMWNDAHPDVDGRVSMLVKAVPVGQAIGEAMHRFKERIKGLEAGLKGN